MTKPRRAREPGRTAEPPANPSANPPANPAPEYLWLKAAYHAHTFHYRTPDLGAILAINPGIPSPLTVKLALVAVLLQQQRVSEAEALARALHQVEVRIRPPAAALTFRAFMRYVRPPDSPDKTDKGTASKYITTPYQREYTLWAGSLEVYLGVPGALSGLVAESLAAIPYLGAKDSLVTCLGVEAVNEPPADVAAPLDPAAGVDALPAAGLILQLADLIQPPQDLKSLLPGERRARDYRVAPYHFPGTSHSTGGSRVYTRDQEGALRRFL